MRDMNLALATTQ